MTFPIIDAHQHIWDPAQVTYEWLGPELAPINTAMLFDRLTPELTASGVDFTVCIQSGDSPEDTDFMRTSALTSPRIVGIVGFAPLGNPQMTATVLDSWASDSLMVGVRNLTHTHPDTDWLLRPEVEESLTILAERGLPLDIVAVLPRHLEVVAILSERHPDLRMVIDHLGTPPVGMRSQSPWAELITTVAANPLVCAKLSGLYSATADRAAWTTEQIRPAFERAVEIFGPRRLMYGGDWPISILAGGYMRVWEGLRPLFDELGEDDQEWILGRTAAQVYSLQLPVPL